MKNAASITPMPLERNQRISQVIQREQDRLRHFIRRRVPDPRDAEDMLQDVFYELVEANRLLMPIEPGRRPNLLGDWHPLAEHLWAAPAPRRRLPYLASAGSRSRTAERRRRAPSSRMRAVASQPRQASVMLTP